MTSVAVLENSHSVASASEDGSVHVWRVDAVSEMPTSGTTGSLQFLNCMHSSLSLFMIFLIPYYHVL